MRWQSLAKVLCCGPAHGGVQAGVQTAVARSGKGAVQGAVQACCEAAAYSAVAKSGRGAVLSKVLYRLWLAAVRSGGKVWETCCAACCRLARSGKGYAAGLLAARGSCSQKFSKVLQGGRSLAWCCAVQAAVQSGGDVWQRCCAECCAGCWPEYRAGLLRAECCAVLDSAVANSGKGAGV